MIEASKPQPTLFRVIPLDDRLYGLILPLIVSLDTLFVALVANADRSIALDSRREFALIHRGCLPNIMIETREPTMQVLADKPPAKLEFFHTVPIGESTTDRTPLTQQQLISVHSQQLRLPAHMRLLLELGANAFLKLYESNIQWIHNNVSFDKTLWPVNLRFANIVRNAIAHAGRVSWGDSKRPPVNWKGFSYSHADNGQTIIGREIDLTVLFHLIFDFSDELDKLGCPTVG